MFGGNGCAETKTRGKGLWDVEMVTHQDEKGKGEARGGRWVGSNAEVTP